MNAQRGKSEGPRGDDLPRGGFEGRGPRGDDLMVKMAAETAAPGVLPADRAQARELRQRYGFLREVVAEMERVVPYAAAAGQRGGRGAPQPARRRAAGRARDPQQGIVLTAVSGDHLEEVATDAIDPDLRPPRAQELARPGARLREQGSGHAADRPRARSPGRGLRHAGGARSRAGDAGAEAGALRGPAPAASGSTSARCKPGALRGRGGDEGLRQPQPVRDRDHPPRARGPHPLRLGRAAAPLRLAQRGGHGGSELVAVGDATLEQMRDTAVALLGARPVPRGPTTWSPTPASPASCP